jgi:hypothetical protein
LPRAGSSAISQREWWNARNGQQIGDPAKLAQALLTVAALDQPPRRFMAGADAIAAAERKWRLSSFSPPARI